VLQQSTPAPPSLEPTLPTSVPISPQLVPVLPAPAPELPLPGVGPEPGTTLLPESKPTGL